jgi:hypothetical protein
MYALWLQRNKHRHGAVQIPVKKLVQWSVDTAHDLCQLLRDPKPKAVAIIRKWSAPPAGWVKCNTDGAFYADQGQGASGVVLRDPAGTFRGGRARWHRHGLNALSMEAVACAGKV